MRYPLFGQKVTGFRESGALKSTKQSGVSARSIPPVVRYRGAMAASSWQLLSTDIILRVFQLLPPSSRATLRAVCRQWRRVGMRLPLRCWLFLQPTFAVLLKYPDLLASIILHSTVGVSLPWS